MHAPVFPPFLNNRYDSHRDQILRSGERHQAGGGSAEFAGGQRPDNEPDLYQFFTASCFSGFGDGPKVGVSTASGFQQPAGGGSAADVLSSEASFGCVWSTETCWCLAASK